MNVQIKNWEEGALPSSQKILRSARKGWADEETRREERRANKTRRDERRETSGKKRGGWSVI